MPFLADKMKKLISILTLFVLTVFSQVSITYAQNNPPAVENVTASQRTDGSKIVDIYYDVSDADGDLLFITLMLSEDAGGTFTITPTQSTGDIGNEIQPGTGKHIIWNAGDENYGLEGSQYQFKIIADDVLPVTDIDGNVYQRIQIGDQIWMAENLKVTHYNDGTEIPTGYSDDDWANLSTDAYAVYDDNESNADTYGYMYNWYAVETDNLAPEGWHVPTDEEWTALSDYLGGSSVAGGKMKECTPGSCPESEYWNSPNTGATNESGFTGLPGGYRNYYGGYYLGMGYYGYFWSSTEYGNYNAWHRELNYDYSGVYRFSTNKHYGFSVRCIRD
jgi:uncharacterized protein (TIGR02145 family)